MNFQRIRVFDDKKVKNVYNSYCQTFPEAERRDKKQFEKLFDKKEVQILSISASSEFVGYLIAWNLDNFTFLEHFEVFETFRNRKFGAEILKNLKTTNSKIVLETEPKDLNEFANRRIQFYQRNGFEIISDSYTQPSYGAGKPALDMFLLATWLPENVDKLIEEIHKVVYEK